MTFWLRYAMSHYDIVTKNMLNGGKKTSHHNGTENILLHPNFSKNA